MALLSSSQQQQYLNLINQASIRLGTYKALVNTIAGPKSIEELNNLCARATKIDIAKFQAITAPVVAQAPVEMEKTSDVAPVAGESKAPEAVVEEAPAPAPQTPVTEEVKLNTTPDAAPIAIETKAPEAVVEEAPVPAPQAPVTEEVKLDTTSNVAPVVTTETPAPAPRKTINFNFSGKKTENKTAKTQVEETKPALKFFTCDDNQVKRDEAAVVNEGTKKALAEAIAKCGTWAESNDDAYLYNKDKCENAGNNVEVMKATCYVNIIPQNIAPKNDTGIAVYSCDEVDNNYVKQANPFTYLYNSEEGQAQHLRDCANWMLEGGYALAYGENTCVSFLTAETTLTGCLHPQE